MLNKVLQNNINEIMKRETNSLVYCPKCKTRLVKSENTYMGVPFLTHIHCPVCQWQPSEDEK